MSLENVTKHFGTFKVKPVWKLITVSSLLSADAGIEIQLYGVDRGSLDIVRNWEKINSVEHFNQGWAKHPTDFTVTIAMKTKGTPFEKMRRIGPGNIMFDIELDILKSNNVPVGGLSEDEATDLGLPAGWVPWLVGYEGYLGCVIQREGRVIEIGGIPVQEFECGFLKREIKPFEFYGYDTSSIEEGDGTTPSVDLTELDL